jgi:hypothetical protein
MPPARRRTTTSPSRPWRGRLASRHPIRYHTVRQVLGSSGILDALIIDGQHRVLLAMPLHVIIDRFIQKRTSGALTYSSLNERYRIELVEEVTTLLEILGLSVPPGIAEVGQEAWTHEAQGRNEDAAGKEAEGEAQG